MAIQFIAQDPKYNTDQDTVWIPGRIADGSPLIISVSGAALDAHFGAADDSPQERLRAFEANRAVIEAQAIEVYRQRGLTEPGILRLTSGDF